VYITFKVFTNIKILREEEERMSYADIRSKKRTASKLIGDGMKQLHTDELIGRILTVTDVEAMNARNGRCGVMIFAEYPDCFYFAGKVLTEMCDQFLEDESAMDEMHAGKVQIVINKKRSDTTGREYVTFDYVGDEPESADGFVNADEADMPFGNN
jgi:hypothetical protein